MITELTEEQKSKFPIYVDKWIGIGLNIEPANRELAEEALRECYEIGGLNHPERIVWCGSPDELIRESALYITENPNNLSLEELMESDAFKENKRLCLQNCGYGQHDAAWLGFYDYFRTELGLVEETNKIVGLSKLAQHAGWFVPFEKTCFISERACCLNRDENGRMHSLSGPAIEFPDGWNKFVIHGVRVPDFFVTNPEAITVQMIDAEDNSEMRRIMTDQYERDTPNKYLLDSGAILIDADVDQFGFPIELYKKPISENKDPNIETDVIMVKLINSTPEPDGTRKVYIKTVPPEITSAKEAVAWAYYETVETYHPKVET